MASSWPASASSAADRPRTARFSASHGSSPGQQPIQAGKESTSSGRARFTASQPSAVSISRAVRLAETCPRRLRPSSAARSVMTRMSTSARAPRAAASRPSSGAAKSRSGSGGYLAAGQERQAGAGPPVGGGGRKPGAWRRVGRSRDAFQPVDQAPGQRAVRGDVHAAQAHEAGAMTTDPSGQTGPCRRRRGSGPCPLPAAGTARPDRRRRGRPRPRSQRRRRWPRPGHRRSGARRSGRPARPASVGCG